MPAAIRWSMSMNSMVSMIAVTLLSSCVACASADDGQHPKEQFHQTLAGSDYLKIWYLPPGQYAIPVKRDQIRSRAHRTIELNCRVSCTFGESVLGQAVASSSRVTTGCDSGDFRILLEFGGSNEHRHLAFVDDTYRCTHTEWGIFVLPQDIRQLVNLALP